MRNWRDVKRKALRPVHGTFRLPAVYLTHAAGVAKPIKVRLHQALAQQSADFSDAPPASLFDTVDRIGFDEAEISEIHTKSYVIFSDTEAYRIGTGQNRREGFIWAICTDVPKAELTQFLASVDTSGDAWKTVAPWSLQQ